MLAYDTTQVPTIARFMNSDAFIRGLVGPLGGGKSSGCVFEVAQRGVAQVPMLDGVRRSRWVVIRNTNKQLEDSTIKTFMQWFPPHVHGLWTPSKGNYLLRSLKAGSREPPAEIEVQFRALDRPDQVGNLLSTEYTGGWINEGREVPWAVYEALMGRVGRFPAMRDVAKPYWSGIFADTNPPDTESDWYRFFEEMDHTEAVQLLSAALKKRNLPGVGIDDYAAIFKQPSGLGADAENLANLQPAYYERQMVGRSPDWIKVYLKGEYGFTVDGKPVYPEYSDEIHCPSEERLKPRVVRGVEVYRSYDFGLTPACVFSQVLPDGRWVIVDELVSTSMGFDEFSDVVLEHSNAHYPGMAFTDVGDPAGSHRAQTDTKTCFEIGTSKGIDIQAAPQSPNLRWEGVRKPLRTLRSGRPQFVLHDRCIQLRKAMMGGYHFRRMKVTGERYSDLPEKNMASHVADALGYAGAWIFGPGLRGFDQVDEERGGRGRGRRDASPLADRTRSATTGY